MNRTVAAMDDTGTRRARLHVVEPDGKTDERPPFRLQTFSAAELDRMEFPPPKWAVPGIIAEGVSLLCGPPKVGKSWLSLGLGLAVATGTKALDMIPVEAGPVLYLALEDTKRRLQSRERKVCGGGQLPDALEFVTDCPPLTVGGDHAIADWLDQRPGARMVIIDVFAKMRGQNMPGMSAYDADYAAVGRIKKVADHYAVPILLVHHVRKAGADDFLAEVSGTNGIAGAADAVIVLKRARGTADGILHVTGRDVDESEYALAFHSGTGTWQLLEGPADEHALGETRAAIIRWLRANPGGTAPKAIAEGTGLGYDTVKKTCQRMLGDSQIICDPGGRYRLPEGHPPKVSPVSPESPNPL